jgi:hypothetical protein
VTRIQAARVMYDPIELIVVYVFVNLSNQILTIAMKRDFLLDLNGRALLSEPTPGLFEPMQMDYEASRELEDACFPHHFVLIALAASDFDVIFYDTSELLP